MPFRIYEMAKIKDRNNLSSPEKSAVLFLELITVGTHSHIPLLYHLFSGLAGIVSKWKGIVLPSKRTCPPTLTSYKCGLPSGTHRFSLTLLPKLNQV